MQESEHIPSHIRGELAFVFPLLRLLPLCRRVAPRRQNDAFASATNVVFVEDLTLQAVALPLTACRNLVGRHSRETLCFFREHRAMDPRNPKVATESQEQTCPTKQQPSPAA